MEYFETRVDFWNNLLGKKSILDTFPDLTPWLKFCHRKITRRSWPSLNNLKTAIEKIKVGIGTSVCRIG